MCSSAPTGDLVGYSIEELRHFLVSADRRIAELQSFIATARAALRTPEPDPGTNRQRLAGLWVAAWQEAEAIRAHGDREAQAIVEAARRVASHASAAGPTQVASRRGAGEGVAGNGRS